MPLDHPAGVSEPPCTFPGKSFGPGEQAANASHVRIAVAVQPVAHAVKHKRAVFERLQRLQALLKLEILARFVRPEAIRHDAVRAEHNDKALLPSVFARRGKAGEIADKRQQGRANADCAQELTPRTAITHDQNLAHHQVRSL